MGASTPEGKVKRKVIAVLNERKIWYFCPVTSGYSRSGVPDIICIVNGLFVGIECKATPAHKLTPLQEKCKQEVMQSGGKWFLVCDVTSLNVFTSWLDHWLARNLYWIPKEKPWENTNVR